MKKTIILCMLALAQHAIANAAADSDTLIVSNPNRVVVVTSDSLQSIAIEGSANNPAFRYSNTIELVDSNYVSTSSINEDTWEFSLNPFKKEKSVYTTNKTTQRARKHLSTWFAAGFCAAPGAPDVMDVRSLQSWELWWVICETRFHPWRDNNAFSIGVGVDWRNYRITNDYFFAKDNDRINLEQHPDEANPNFSRVKVFSVNFPMRYHYRSRDVSFSFGPVLNLNLHSSLKTRYSLADGKHKDTANDVHATPVTVDFMGTVRASFIQMYVKYSPCNVIESGYGPKFKSLSFGFLL